MKSVALLATTLAADGGRSMARADAAAVQFALAAGSDALAICPPGDNSAREYALAAGINQVLVSEAWASREVQVAFVGTGFAEQAGDWELARWAEQLGATLLFDVLRCHPQANQVHEVLCDAGRGARHQLRVQGPLVLVLSSQIERPIYVSRSRRQIARLSQPHDESQISNSEVLVWQSARPRVKVRTIDSSTSAADRMDSAFSIQSDSRNSSSHVIAADPETCARHVLRYLAHHGFISESASPELSAESPSQPSSTSAAVITGAPPSVTISLGAALGRRPRQTQDSAARRARRPRPFTPLIN